MLVPHADGTLLIHKPFRRLSNEVCFKRMQLQQALLYEAPPAVSGSRPACIKSFDNIMDGADAFIRCLTFLRSHRVGWCLQA